MIIITFVCRVYAALFSSEGDVMTAVNILTSPRD